MPASTKSCICGRAWGITHARATCIAPRIDLPGIGRSTAGAILAQAHGARLAILDGNVKRVLSRHYGIDGAPDEAVTLASLWQRAEENTPTHDLANYTQAIMDLGATLCARKPRCAECPIAADCVARIE